MNWDEPAYELVVSRVFGAPPPAVRRAFTDPELRARWLPADGRPVPDPAGSAGDGSLMWAEHQEPSSDAGDGPVGSSRAVRVELDEQPGGKTLLELHAGPYTEAGERNARAWWNSAFSHLDALLEHGGQ